MEEFRKLTNFMTRDEKEATDIMLQGLQTRLNVEEHVEIIKAAGVEALTDFEANLFGQVQMSSSFFWAQQKILLCYFKIETLKMENFGKEESIRKESMTQYIQDSLENLSEAWKEKNEEVENLKERTKFFNHLVFLFENSTPI